MSWTRLALVAVLMASGTAACAATSCPATNRGHKLTDVDVFDEPPADLASLEPDNGWTLDHKPSSPAGRFHLHCRYDGTTSSRQIEPPLAVRACRTTTDPQVICR